MTVVERTLESIRPYDHNPRKNAPAVDAVAASIGTFGFRVPIVVDSKGEIVAGHTRYLAAQKLGLELVPCVLADDLTPQQVRAYRLADNKTAELAQWDCVPLAQELQAITGIDMSVFGFDAADLDAGVNPLDLEDNPEFGGGTKKTCRCPKCGFEFAR